MASIFATEYMNQIKKKSSISSLDQFKASSANDMEFGPKPPSRSSELKKLASP